MLHWLESGLWQRPAAASQAQPFWPLWSVPAAWVKGGVRAGGAATVGCWASPLTPDTSRVPQQPRLQSRNTHICPWWEQPFWSSNSQALSQPCPNNSRAAFRGSNLVHITARFDLI